MGESRAARWLQILRWEAEGPPIEREAEVLMEVERERARSRMLAGIRNGLLRGNLTSDWKEMS